jgi:hypothetical protein
MPAGIRLRILSDEDYYKHIDSKFPDGTTSAAVFVYSNQTIYIRQQNVGAMLFAAILHELVHADDFVRLGIPKEKMHEGSSQIGQIYLLTVMERLLPPLPIPGTSYGVLPPLYLLPPDGDFSDPGFICPKEQNDTFWPLFSAYDPLRIKIVKALWTLEEKIQSGAKVSDTAYLVIAGWLMLSKEVSFGSLMDKISLVPEADLIALAKQTRTPQEFQQVMAKGFDAIEYVLFDRLPKIGPDVENNHICDKNVDVYLSDWAGTHNINVPLLILAFWRNLNAAHIVDETTLVCGTYGDASILAGCFNSWYCDEGVIPTHK